MGGVGSAGLPRRSFEACVALAVGVALLQSAVHLQVVLGAHDLHSTFDLDRSNGIPDLVSTLALAAAALGAATLAAYERGASRLVPLAGAAVLTGLTVADALHDGAHPSSSTGRFVIGLVVAAGALLAAIAVGSSHRTRATLAVGACLLAGSFLVNGLDELDQWFERARGDAVVELQIVAKEGLELVGWSLVALALWDEAYRRRAARVRHSWRG